MDFTEKELQEAVSNENETEELRKNFKSWHQTFTGTDSQYFNEFSDWVNKFKKYNVNLYYADFSENPTKKNCSKQ